MKMVAIKDRYGGAYQGGKYLIVYGPDKKLTQEELNIINPYVEKTDEFYNSWPWMAAHQSSSQLPSGSTRLDAVKVTALNADCYAAFELAQFEWFTVTDSRPHNVLEDY